MESRKRDAKQGEEVKLEDDAQSAKKSKKATDFREYYGQIKNQQNMLQDYVRTGSYYNAVMQNAHDFRGKVVLDVGTGSGILAFFAARAGARRVYAVEGSEIARKARKLLEANGFGNVVQVIQEQLANVELPEKVDIIISEPLGVLLVHERMLETYVQARSRFLKPGGMMFPTVSTIFLAPFTDRALHEEQEQRADFWKTQNFYGLDLSALYGDAREEHFSQPVVGIFDPDTLMSKQTAQLVVDYRTVREKDLHQITIPFRLQASRTELVHGIATWFDSDFIGTGASVPMSTSPHAPPTHWQQCRLLLQDPIAINTGQWIVGVLEMHVNDHYSYNIKLTVALEGSTVTTTQCYELQNQLYRYLPTTPAQLQQQQDYINNATAPASHGAPIGGMAAAASGAPLSSSSSSSSASSGSSSGNHLGANHQNGTGGNPYL